MHQDSPPPPTIVVIGASAGGVEALCALLRAFPAGLRAIVMIVLHRPIEHESRLREILSRVSHLPVIIAHNGQKLRPGVCYIGDPRRHLMLGPDARALLLEDHFYRSHNIDALFNSAAQAAGARSIGIILSGNLKDGALGLAAIKRAGGRAFVQSPEEATYKEMPRSAIEYDGPIDLVAPINRLAVVVSDIVFNEHSARTDVAGENSS
jgi:two-component system chemotaxis response regulator CheB